MSSVSLTTGVRDRVTSAQCVSIGQLAGWTLAAASMPFVAPLVAVFVLRPGFLPIIAAVAWVVVAYVVMTYVGVAWVVAGGHVRRIGAALIVGEVLGAVVFASCVLLVVHRGGAASN